MDVTRRSFLGALGGATVLARHVSANLAEASLPHPPGGRLGLELYSLRNELKKDLAGALRTAREWGFERVEIAGFPPMTAADTARALRAAGLQAVSAFVDYDRLRDDFAGAVADARTLGLEYLICGWIPHDKTLTRTDVDRAIASFNRWGAMAAAEKLRLGYHIHGYEFVAG